jgi:hypothetical protein
MDTDQLLRLAQKYVEHERAPYVGGASLLVGVAVWFYATDISRVFKVGSESRGLASVLTHVTSIPPIASGTSKDRARHRFPAHLKTPVPYDSQMGTI